MLPDLLRHRLLLAVLLVPMLWPALHGSIGALLTAMQGGTLAGGASLWPTARVWGLFGQGVALALLAGLVATACAAACAATFLLPLSRRVRGALVAALAASFCFGTVVHLLAWRVPFPGVSGGPSGWAVAALVLGLRYAPLAALLLTAGLATLERAELETALVSGGSRALWRVARARLVRLAGMSLAAVAALVFGESELPPLVGVHVYAEEFLSQVALEPDPHLAAALGWPLMAVALASAVLLAGLPRLQPGSRGAVRTGWLGEWVHAPVAVRLSLPALAFAAAALPLLLLAAGSLQASGRMPAHATEALFSSVAVAAGAALLATLWGWALAGAAARAGAQRGFNLLAWIAMLWPSALTGLAIAAAGLPDGLGSATPLVLAHALRLLPFAAWLLLALQDAQAPGPREQLRVLGTRGLTAWRHVALPAALPGLAAAFALGVGLSLAELTATVLTVPAGMETVILRLYNLLHYGDQRGVMVLALMQGGVVALLVAVAAAAAARHAARTEGAPRARA